MSYKHILALSRIFISIYPQDNSYFLKYTLSYGTYYSSYM